MKNSYVYWIHLPEHTDVFTEGYVGVSKYPERRLTEHKKFKRNSHLTYAFKKYKNIVHTILLQGPEDYCFEIETKLRPTEEIGWNLAVGGQGGYTVKRDDLGKYNIQNKTKDYTITDPSGNVFDITNIRQFSREHNLHHQHLIKVAKGKYSQHKGYKCAYKEAA